MNFTWSDPGSCTGPGPAQLVRRIQVLDPQKNFAYLYRTQTKKKIFLLPLSIAEGVIGVKLAAGGDDDTGAMRRQLQKESAKTPNGAAFRWAVGAAPNGFLELQLQSLPAPAAVVNRKPMLRNVSIFTEQK